MDLGSTLGIRSLGPGDGSSGPGKNGALATICHFTQGADINLILSGNLDIFSTTICALTGGNIFIDAAGYVNVGSTSFTGNDEYVRGVFTPVRAMSVLLRAVTSTSTVRASPPMMVATSLWSHGWLRGRG